MTQLKNPERRQWPRKAWKVCLQFIFFMKLVSGNCDEMNSLADVTAGDVSKEQGVSAGDVLKQQGWNVVAEIPLDKLQKCGEYCQFVRGCKSLRFDGKTCHLLNASLPRSAANGTYVASIGQWRKEKCTEVHDTMMAAKKFTIQSNDKTLFFSEESSESYWKKTSALYWVYNRTSQQLRVYNTTLCLTWTATTSHRSQVYFANCQATLHQRLTFVRLGTCTWKLGDYSGNNLYIPLTMRLPNKTALFTRQVVVFDRPPQEIPSEGFNLRNISSFQVGLGTVPVTCGRPALANGVLSPDKRSAPVFFSGQKMTFQCNEQYAMRQERQRVVLTCGRLDKTRLPKCSAVENDRIVKYVFLGLICLATFSIVSLMIPKAAKACKRKELTGDA